ncbi:MAG: phosphoribosylanthranilate isomerase [Planctomycetes bacterium]|nr:phosphoribosylanthranilate isomerase [Planctomycetota bacterium]
MTLVKICGLTNRQDALAAVDYGADMLGFVFTRSVRQISPAKAAEIIKVLPENIITVGVFVNEPAGQLEDIARRCHLSLAQLHGSETRQYTRKLSVPFIKAFRAADKGVLGTIADFCVETFILDAYDPGQAGGTGKRVDWQIAAKAAKLGRVILAGGLNPENVTEAIKTVNPYGVDISSGIEISPGQKDHGKMRKFITEVKRQPCD